MKNLTSKEKEIIMTEENNRKEEEMLVHVANFGILMMFGVFGVLLGYGIGVAI